MLGPSSNEEVMLGPPSHEEVGSELSLNEIRESIASIRQRIECLQSENLMMMSAAANSSSSYPSGAPSLQPSNTESNPGDIFFLLFCTILVLLMTMPGIMLYYSGLVRLQNVLSTAIQGYVITSLIVFLWLCVGYTICFGTYSYGGIIGSFDKVWLTGVSGAPYGPATEQPEYVFYSFQLAFAIITPSLICGAFANRMKFWAVISFISLWHLIVYCPIAHCFWHPEGWLARWGAADFAGGFVVHISAGFSALVSALMVGKHKRHRRFRHFHPHNKIMSATGACFLIIGWYGFNAGSALSANPQASMAFLNSQIAGSTASVTWMIIDIVTHDVPSFDGIMNGCLAGLVAITPCAGFVDPIGAFVIGTLGGAITSQGIKIKEIFEFDDALDAFGIHGIAGVVGVLLTALFARKEISGDEDKQGLLYGGRWSLLGIQVVGIWFTVAWGCCFTAVILFVVDKTVGLRVSAAKELMGLDTSEHGTTSSQMKNVPPPRTARRATMSGSASNSSSGSEGESEGGFLRRIGLPNKINFFQKSFSSTKKNDVKSSSTTSHEVLTIENKKFHDQIYENKPIDKFQSLNGSLKRSSSSHRSLNELDISSRVIKSEDKEKTNVSDGVEMIVQKEKVSQDKEQAGDYFVDFDADESILREDEYCDGENNEF